ncbi:fibronectin type III domain-containing protein [Flagellimonas nanhaiensis]|nr:fibronectin type III domain-containing protein [Allomuricauda nanhaiensis]
MKHFKIYILFGLSVLGIASVQSQQLHTHSNAASMSNEANSVSGWGGSATESSVSSEVYSGSYSIKLESPNNGWNYAAYTFATTANEQYVVTFYAKSASSSNPALYWGGGGVVENQKIDITSSNWTQYSKTVTANGTNIALNIYPGSPALAGESVYIDYFSITPLSGADTQAPTAPSLLSNGQTDTTVDLSWSGATDNTGVTNYKVFKDGVLETTLGNVSSYQVTGLTASTAYSFTVTALDAAGNESVASNAVPVTTSSTSGGGTTGGHWTQDGTNIYYNDGNVGIGTTNPSELLDINGNIEVNRMVKIDGHGAVGSLQIMDNTDTGTYDVLLRGDAGSSYIKSGSFGIGTSNPLSKVHIFNGSSGQNPHNYSDLSVEDTDHVMISLMTYNTKQAYYGFADTDDGFVGGIQYSHPDDALHFRVNNHSSDMMIDASGNVGIGTTSPDAKLAVKGNIHAEEVKVDLSVPGPDYVFKEDYDLKSLEEVQNHIKAHGHLPNIPSAKEMEANGIDLGEMNMKLLEKIEELTLYILEQEKKLEIQNFQIEKLENKDKRIVELENRLKKIEQFLNQD